MSDTPDTSEAALQKCLDLTKRTIAVWADWLAENIRRKSETPVTSMVQTDTEKTVAEPDRVEAVSAPVAAREVLTEKGFAACGGLSEITIARRRKARRITYRRDGGKIFYLAPDDVDDYFERMKRPARPSLRK